MGCIQSMKEKAAQIKEKSAAPRQEMKENP